MEQTEGRSIESLVGEASQYLSQIETEIVNLVQRNLDARASGAWSGNDDALFEPYTAYIIAALRCGFQLRPVFLWINEISPRVSAVENRIGQLIHKGAPLYNTGLCQFLVGDFARAAQYMDAAGEEDERRAPGSARRLITGGGVAENLLMPVYNWLNQHSGLDYQAATGSNFSDQEFRDLVNYLARRTSDAVLLLSALQRITLVADGPDVFALHFQRVRALADLLLVLESNLRLWQGQASNLTQLQSRSRELLRTNVQAFTVFNQIDQSYPNFVWEQAANINIFTTNEIRRFDISVQRSEKAAIALYTSYRLRNSLMHIMEEQLDIFNNIQKITRLLNFALISIRLSRFGAEGQMGSL